jgi:hypothetical protein
MKILNVVILSFIVVGCSSSDSPGVSNGGGGSAAGGSSNAAGGAAGGVAGGAAGAAGDATGGAAGAAGGAEGGAAGSAAGAAGDGGTAGAPADAATSTGDGSVDPYADLVCDGSNKTMCNLAFCNAKKTYDDMVRACSKTPPAYSATQCTALLLCVEQQKTCMAAKKSGCTGDSLNTTDCIVKLSSCTAAAQKL